MTQTAIDWLYNQLTDDWYDKKTSKHILEQANDMYRTQLIDCGNSCALKQHLHIDKINKMTESEIRQFAEEEHLTFGEEYYNETFGEDEKNNN